jgi:itaconyl-CoA hydratase
MPLKENQLGRYFEDFEIGDVYRSSLGRTITDADNTWFTLLTMNTNQSHFNSHYAETTPFGKVIVNSGLTVALVLGLSVLDTSQKAFANLGWEKIRLPNPVFVGDTIYAESTVLDKRESKSRPYGGIVSFRTRGLNQHGTTVLVYERSVFIYKRDAENDKSYFPEPDVPIEEL